MQGSGEPIPNPTRRAGSLIGIPLLGVNFASPNRQDTTFFDTGGTT